MGLPLEARKGLPFPPGSLLAQRTERALRRRRGLASFWYLEPRMRSATIYRYAVPAAILIVLLNAWVAMHALGTLFAAERWLAHTLEVLRVSDDAMLQYTTANSSARGYLLTADPIFSTRFESAEIAVKAAVDHLKVLTADNPLQQERVALLRSRLAVKLGTLEAAMVVRRGHAGGAVDPLILQPALADSPDGGITVRYAVDQITAEEDRLLNNRTQETHAARQRVIATFVGATLLDLLFLIVAFRLLLASTERRAQLAARAAEINQLNAELTLLNSGLESSVERRTLELQAANKELEAFSYSVSHDLRAPLRTIDGFSLALQEDFAEALNDEGRDYIKRVRTGVQRMGTLIDALLQLSRVTRSEVVRETVDFSQLATNVFNELQAGEPERRVEWSAEPGVAVEGDTRLLRVALENLIGNAWKFTARTPAAKIAFGSSPREAGSQAGTVYFIRDNGAGFDMAYVDRLFTAFQRLHGDRDFKGSGIGLATVSRIISRHHGHIWAESQVGHGATFSFTLAAPASSAIAVMEKAEPAIV